MSVVLYDEALLNKIKKWVLDPKITITGVNETSRVFEYKADTSKNENVKLPLIALRRLSPYRLKQTVKTPLSSRGWKIEASDEKISQLNCIPISINYQLDIYTRFLEEAEEYARNFVFNIINYPKVSIVIPYNKANLPYISNVRISEEIDDNSDIPERLIPGQFTRKTLNLYIDDAYLFDYNTKDTLSLETELEVELDNIVIKN